MQIVESKSFIKIPDRKLNLNNVYGHRTNYHLEQENSFIMIISRYVLRSRKRYQHSAGFWKNKNLNISTVFHIL